MNLSCVLIHRLNRSVTRYQKVKTKRNSATAQHCSPLQNGRKSMVEAKEQVPSFFQLSLLCNGFIRQAKSFHKTDQSHTAGFSAPPGQ